MRTCAFSKCDVRFSPRTKRQRYCSQLCQVYGWQEKNPDRRRAALARYRESHRSQCNESKRRWEQANPGRRREIVRRYWDNKGRENQRRRRGTGQQRVVCALPECTTTFVPTRQRYRYCSETCAVEAKRQRSLRWKHDHNDYIREYRDQRRIADPYESRDRMRRKRREQLRAEQQERKPA